MIERLKHLITAVENLGLDTQPLRDLMASGETDFTQYESRISNLEREVKNHPPGSQPQQVQILVKHVRPIPKEASFKGRNINLTAENYIIQKQEPTVDPLLAEAITKMGALMEKLANEGSPQHEANVVGQDSTKVLEAIEALNNKVDNIKISGSNVPVSDPDAPKIQEGFVNPLDEDEVRKISGKIHVSPKKGKSLASSLRKLRGHKK